MFGVEKPAGIVDRDIVLNPHGNNEEAAAARKALAVYAQELALSPRADLKSRAADVAVWIMQEEAFAENTLVNRAMMGDDTYGDGVLHDAH